MYTFPVASPDRRGGDRTPREEPTMITTTAPAARTATSSSQALLTCGAVAGPLWAVVSLAQAATREGFDISRHPLSALSNGALGWLQIANFVVAGVLMVI